MWTDKQTDSHPRARSASAPSAGRPTYQPVRPALVAYYVARGRHLRAQAIAGMARHLTERLCALFGRRRSTQRPAEAGAEGALSALAEDFKSPLTAIRSSAEILRDHPDIDPIRRRRFVDIVLSEEARLEALVAERLDPTALKPAPGVRRFRPNGLRLGPAQGGCP